MSTAVCSFLTGRRANFKCLGRYDVLRPSSLDLGVLGPSLTSFTKVERREGRRSKVKGRVLSPRGCAAAVVAPVVHVAGCTGLIQLLVQRIEGLHILRFGGLE